MKGRSALADHLVEFMSNSVKCKAGKKSNLQGQCIGLILDKLLLLFFLFTVIILCVVEVIIILMLIFLRNRIRIAIALLKEGSRYVCLILKYF